jgi:hypothetical protein
MNWFMGQASHPLAGGTFSVRSMISLDPATITHDSRALSRALPDGRNGLRQADRGWSASTRSVHGTSAPIHASARR